MNAECMMDVVSDERLDPGRMSFGSLRSVYIDPLALIGVPYSFSDRMFLCWAKAKTSHEFQRKVIER